MLNVALLTPALAGPVARAVHLVVIAVGAVLERGIVGTGTVRPAPNHSGHTV